MRAVRTVPWVDTNGPHPRNGFAIVYEVDPYMVRLLAPDQPLLD